MKLLDKLFKKTSKPILKEIPKTKPKKAEPTTVPKSTKQPKITASEEAKFLEALKNKRVRTTYQLRNQGFANPLAIAERLQAKGIKLRIEPYSKEEKLIIKEGE